MKIKKILRIPIALKERYQLYNYVYPFALRNATRHSNENNSVVLYCQPRSGSTWLAEILLNIPQSCLIDEPLWRGRFKKISSMPNIWDRKIPRVSELGFYHYQPIKEDEDWSEAISLFDGIISGRVPSLFLYNDVKLSKLTNAKYHIVKCNHGQLLFHWVVKHFKVKHILLTRHPCAVVASQLKMPGIMNFKTDKPNRFPEFRNSTLFNQHVEVLDRIYTTEELLAFMWAIQTKHSLYHTKNNIDWLTTSYEKLVLDFDNEVERIFKFLNKKLPEGIEKMSRTPSKSAKHGSLKNILNGNQIDNWTNILTKDQINRILNVTERMGVDLYTDDLEPNYDVLYKGHPKP